MIVKAKRPNSKLSLFYKKSSHTFFSIWATLHIGLIVISSSYFAFDKYCKYYGIKPETHLKKMFINVLGHYPARLYGRLSGATSSYGFFAPDVKSNGIIIGSCNGKKIEANFKTFEAGMRYNVLSSKITDYILKSQDSVGIENEQSSKQFFDLAFKSVAVKIYNQNNCTQDTIFVSYNILAFPTLKDYALGYHNYQLIPVKEMKLTKKS